MTYMNKELVELIANRLHISIEEVENYKYRELPEIDAIHIWNPARGGFSILIDSDNKMLIATSSVNFKNHLKGFLMGIRN